MGHQFVARKSELVALIGSRPFLALPKEEIARLYGTLAIDVVAPEAAAADPGLLRLGTLAVVHRNYTWLTFAAPAAGQKRARSLGLAGLCDPAEHRGVFLDEDFATAAGRALTPVVAAPHYELRLAGLLMEHAVVPEARWLRLVYVARLRQPIGDCCRARGVEVWQMGSGELLERRGEFDAVSCTLIENLAAL